jgi:hypothetical protein
MDTMQDIRNERDRLLSLCDWTVSSDSPLTANRRAQWGAYRQALRDLPGQYTDPSQVVFPTPPES